MNPEEKSQPDDEIDLMDYVKVILKRKIFIVALFLIAVIIAGVFSFLSPKVYKIDTVLEIGQVAGKDIEVPAQVAEKTTGDVYGIFVREKLGLSEKEFPEIKAENLKDTNLIAISSESAEPQKAKQVLSEVIALVLKEHEEKFVEKKSLLEEEIAKTEQELEFLKNQKVYADWGIAQLQLTISELKEKLNASESTRAVKQPVVSENPIKPKPLLNMAIAGILGLFVGVFLAFGREWWENSKDIKR